MSKRRPEAIAMEVADGLEAVLQARRRVEEWGEQKDRLGILARRRGSDYDPGWRW